MRWIAAKFVPCLILTTNFFQGIPHPKDENPVKDEDLRILQRYKLNCTWCWTASKYELPRCIQQWEELLAQFIKLKGTTLKGTLPTCN
jgi:radical SAM superfamily enzyme YgiQ (UPF0313 family)